MNKAITILAMILIGLMTTEAAQAAKPGSSSGAVFLAEISGDVSGSRFSNPTEDKGHLANLVFNKLASQVEFTIALGSRCDGFYGGNLDSLEATMQLYDGLSNDPTLVARFYFVSGNTKYKLELFEPEGSQSFGWSAEFPPFEGPAITRSAGSWRIESLNGRGQACDGETGTLDATVTLSRQ